MSAIATTAPIELWRAVRDFLTTFFHVFGGSDQLTRRAYVNRREHDLIRTWLSAGEHFLRRLLFIEANAIAVPPASCRQTAAWKAAVQREGRTSFRCFPSSPARGGSADPGAKPGEAKGEVIFPTLPLAQRYEALLRVFNNPLPYARRLARILARAATRAAPFRNRPFQRKRKSGDPPPLVDIVGREAWDCMENALPAPNSS